MVNQKKQKSIYTTFWLNVAFLLVAFAFVKGGILNQEGYKWVFGMLEENAKAIKQYSYLNTEQRSEMKMGASYAYFKYVEKNTPSDAIIYIPGREAFFPKGETSLFTGEPFNKMWAIRFLYPRKVVVPQEMGKSLYSNKLTHVAIVNGIGSDKLPYPVPQDLKFGVLPVNNKEMLKQKK